MMGGFEVECTDVTHRLNALEFEKLVAKGDILKLTITESDITEKGQSDWLSKLIACVQILWLVVQLIGRGVQQLPVTPLELFTLGIIVCTLCTYAVFWYKPQNIQQPVLISTDKTLHELLSQRVYSRSYLAIDDGHAVTTTEEIGVLSLVVTVSALFGACHIIAWNFSFPSLIEQLLWRISSIFCMALPLVIIIFSYVHPDIRYGIAYLFAVGLILMYFLARLTLLVEVFVSLRSVPAGVYQTVDWSLYIPHL